MDTGNNPSTSGRTNWSKRRKTHNPSNSLNAPDGTEQSTSLPPPPTYDEVTTTIVSSMIIELDEDFDMINEVIAEELSSGNDTEIDSIMQSACPIVIE